jgi:hypothetical protein
LRLAAVQHQDREHATQPVPAANEMHRDRTAVLAQQIDIEAGDASGTGRGADQVRPQARRYRRA